MLEAILRRPALVERYADWLQLIFKTLLVLGGATMAVRGLGLGG